VPDAASPWGLLLETLPTDTLAQKRDRALILVSAGARISKILRLNRTTGNQTACG
jgi:hypothetical protein